MFTCRHFLLLIAAFSLLAVSTPAFAGRILVNNDEWAFTDFGYSKAGAVNADRLVRNVAEFLTGGSGKILIYSSDHGVVESNFLSSLGNAGYHVDLDKTGATSFDLTTLAQYKAIYLAGDGMKKDDAVLTNYVNQGGNVFLAAGTGIGWEVEEAARWNPFLSNFGLRLGDRYNWFTTTFRGSSSHPVLNGVDDIYYDNGNSVSLTGTNPYAYVIESSTEGFGLFGIYDPPNMTTPEPQTLTLLAAGISLLVLFRRRK